MLLSFTLPLLTFHTAIICRYLPGPDDMLVLDIAYTIYLKFEEYANALQIALFLDNLQVCFLFCASPFMQCVIVEKLYFFQDVCVKSICGLFSNNLNCALAACETGV